MIEIGDLVKSTDPNGRLTHRVRDTWTNGFGHRVLKLSCGGTRYGKTSEKVSGTPTCSKCAAKEIRSNNAR